jgi:hypothetical protein
LKQSFFLYIALLCIAVTSAVSLNSCKEDTILDANIVPVGDTINIVSVPDTFTILTRTVLDDSVITSLSISGVPIVHAIGNVVSDDWSGKTNAGVYLQIIPPEVSFKFSKKPDSAVLILPYAGFAWGDTTVTNTPQRFRVYEVTDSLIKDSIYYSTTKKNYDISKELSDPSEPAVVTFNSIKDSITVNGILRYPHVRIRLSNEFRDRIYNEAANGTGLNSFVEFMRYFKGLYIESAHENVGNTLYYFFLNGSGDFTRANIQFFYTDKSSTNQDTVKYSSFFFDQGLNAHYNRIPKREYVGNSGTLKLVNSTQASEDTFVIQNEPGAALDIRIPFIKNLPKQPIIKAELILTQRKDIPGHDEAKFWEPERLFPVGVYTGGGVYTIQDRLPVSSSEPLIFIDGRRRDVTINGIEHSQYVINIPRELQKAIVEQRDTLHLRINGASQYPGAYRLIGGGRGSDTNTRVKLRIIYSKI